MRELTRPEVLIDFAARNGFELAPVGERWFVVHGDGEVHFDSIDEAEQTLLCWVVEKNRGKWGVRKQS